MITEFGELTTIQQPGVLNKVKDQHLYKGLPTTSDGKKVTLNKAVQLMND